MEPKDDASQHTLVTDNAPYDETISMLRGVTLKQHEDISFFEPANLDDSFLRVTHCSPSLSQEDVDNWSLLSQEDVDNWSLHVNYDSASRSGREGVDGSSVNATYDPVPLSVEGNVGHSSFHDQTGSTLSLVKVGLKNLSYYLDYTSAPPLSGEDTNDSTSYLDYGSTLTVSRDGDDDSYTRTSDGSATRSVAEDDRESAMTALQHFQQEDQGLHTSTLQDILDCWGYRTQLARWEDEDSDDNYTFTERLLKSGDGNQGQADEATPRSCISERCLRL